MGKDVLQTDDIALKLSYIFGPPPPVDVFEPGNMLSLDSKLMCKFLT